ncbi:MAG: hypothetical protein IH935_03550 [Acidobacteria bacterium]|nr:hypothetical protein [Acidobacteriota bacterium]
MQEIFSREALSEPEYMGCLAAFVASFSGHIAQARNFLARLEGKQKGAFFAWEIALDQARYGALIVLERWKELNERFSQSIDGLPGSLPSGESSARAEQACQDLAGWNERLDAAERYDPVLMECYGAALLNLLDGLAQEQQAARSAHARFDQTADTSSKPLTELKVLNVLGSGTSPELSDSGMFHQTRQAFLNDLSRR